MKTHHTPEGKNDEWLTPPEIVNALGQFDLDPCSPIVRPWSTATNHLTIEDDGLTSAWEGRVWLNPPFNRFQRPKWMEKMALHNNGVLLVPAATETEAFQQWVWGHAKAVLFLRARPHFHYVDGKRAAFNSGTAICLAAYGGENVQKLIESDLGTVVRW